MKEMWNTRYASDEFAYGKAPNQFFKDTLDRLNLSGTILLPAEGEGRNAVYAAQKGLSVTAFDISVQGRNKALKLAEENNVEIRYEVSEISELNLGEHLFDAAALIYAHLPPPLRSNLHQEVARRIKPGGFVILEGFSKSNLEIREKNPGIGGPNRLEMLFSKEEIHQEFGDLEVVELQEAQVELNEGEGHNGVGSVIRYIGKKRE